MSKDNKKMSFRKDAIIRDLNRTSSFVYISDVFMCIECNSSMFADMIILMLKELQKEDKFVFKLLVDNLNLCLETRKELKL